MQLVMSLVLPLEFHEICGLRRTMGEIVSLEKDYIFITCAALRSLLLLFKRSIKMYVNKVPRVCYVYMAYIR